MTDSGDIVISVLLDENVEEQVLAYLRAEGHDGEHVVEALGPGVEDVRDIAPYAKEHGYIVVTKATDFLAMDRSAHAGVMFIDNHRLSAYEIATGILTAIAAIPEREYLEHTLFIENWL